MQLTIYFDKKPLILCDNAEKAAAPFSSKAGLIVEKKPTDEKIASMLTQMQAPGTRAGLFEHGDVENLLEAFKKQMTVLQAGGGLVYTPQKTVLLIFRRGKWDLPKGKLDAGENLAQCAIREVQEETGLQQVSLQNLLTTTWHTYLQDGQLVLKESHWYLMQTGSEAKLVPQHDEAIEQCIWVPLQELSTYKQNTHPSILDVLEVGEKAILQATF